MDTVVLKYQSSKNEITEREISNINSKISDNMHKIISAFCHLRGMVRSFNLDNVIEVKVNGKIVDKETFWKKYLDEKTNILKELDKILKKKKKEYEEYVSYVEAMKKYIMENLE